MAFTANDTASNAPDKNFFISTAFSNTASSSRSMRTMDNNLAGVNKKCSKVNRNYNVIYSDAARVYLLGSRTEALANACPSTIVISGLSDFCIAERAEVRG